MFGSSPLKTWDDLFSVMESDGMKVRFRNPDGGYNHWVKAGAETKKATEVRSPVDPEIEMLRGSW